MAIDATIPDPVAGFPVYFYFGGVLYSVGFAFTMGICFAHAFGVSFFVFCGDAGTVGPFVLVAIVGDAMGFGGLTVVVRDV